MCGAENCKLWAPVSVYCTELLSNSAEGLLPQHPIEVGGRVDTHFLADVEQVLSLQVFCTNLPEQATQSRSGQVHFPRGSAFSKVPCIKGKIPKRAPLSSQLSERRIQIPPKLPDLASCLPHDGVSVGMHGCLAASLQHSQG